MSNKFRSREINKNEYENWDNLVDKSPHGTIFHKSWWLKTWSELLDKKLKIFGCFNNKQLKGGCSLFFSKRYGFVEIVSSTCPTTPYGGFVLMPSESTKVKKQEKQHRRKIESLLEAICFPNLHHVTVTHPPSFVDVRPFSWRGWDVDTLYTYYFYLNGPIFENVSKDVRNTSRRATKNDISFRESSNISEFYKLYQKTFERQNRQQPVPERFLKKIYNLAEENEAGKMWIADTEDGESACAEIFLWDSKRAYRWLAASHPVLRKTGATSLLLVEIFRYLKERGFDEMNLMAANTPNLAKFIASFDPQLVPYYKLTNTSVSFRILKKSRDIIKKIYAE